MRARVVLRGLDRIVDIDVAGDIVPGLTRFVLEGEEWLLLERRADGWIARRIFPCTEC